MAEAIFNRCPPEGWHALSAGITASGGKPVSENSVKALAEIGITTDHRSVPTSDALLERCDRIVGITTDHARMLESLFPQHREKIFAFPTDVSDPYGCDLTVYRRCRDQIQAGVDAICAALKK